MACGGFGGHCHLARPVSFLVSKRPELELQLLSGVNHKRYFDEVQLGFVFILVLNELNEIVLVLETDRSRTSTAGAEDEYKMLRLQRG
jgi:hypothetical protein